MNTKPKMSSVIKLEGLMVFHYDESKRICEIGILKADQENLHRGHHKMPPHIFGIKPDPKTGDGEIPQDRLKRLKEEGNIWVLDVEANGSGSAEGKVKATCNIPNRHDPNGDQLDLGWLINVQQEFHPTEPLEINPGALMPIIQLRTGRLYTCCKTDGIDVGEGTDADARRFGFIAECIAIGFDTYENEEIVLKVKKTASDVFRLEYRPGGYRMVIENTPETENHDHLGGETEHFQLYYNLFFRPVKKRCHLIKVSENPTEESPNPCLTITKDRHGATMMTVYPYKCGGITHGQPLG